MPGSPASRGSRQGLPPSVRGRSSPACCDDSARGAARLHCATLSADTGAPVGTWTLRCVEAASNGGKFIVLKPDGSVDAPGLATVGSVYNSTAGINFTIADGTVVSTMTLISHSIHKPGFFSGIFPMMDNAAWERAAVVVRHLPDLRKRLRALERAAAEPPAGDPGTAASGRRDDTNHDNDSARSDR